MDLNKKRLENWYKNKYPLTILKDRYGGIYSGGDYLAFPLEPNNLPYGYAASEVTCVSFWKDYSEPVGKGNTPEEASVILNELIMKELNK